MNLIRRLIAEVNIGVDEETLAKLLLIEAVKSISRILSEILENEYKFSTESVDTAIENDQLTIKYKAAGRVIK